MSTWQFPRSPKHIEVIRDFLYTNEKIYLLWGSVSSGKTVTSLFAWLALIESAPKDAPFAMIGKTERTLEANILDPLSEFLGSKYFEEVRGRGYVRIFGRKIRLYGANDSKAETKIRGKTLYALYGDEVTTWPESFFMMALSRLRLPGAKAIFTTNPDSRNHWLYKNIIERAGSGEISAKLYKFVIEDNPYLPPEYITWISKTYAPGSIWHRRYILGEWSSAEGRVFPFFERSEKFVVSVKSLPDAFRSYLIGIDYGITNPFAAVLLGLRDGVWYVIKEYYHDSRESRRQLIGEDYARAIAGMCEYNGRKIFPEIIVPPEEPEFRKILRKFPDQRIQHVSSADNEVLPGLETLASLLYSGKLKISEACEKTIWGLEELVWDEAACAAGRDAVKKGGSGSPDHICDALRYAARDAAKHLDLLERV